MSPYFLLDADDVADCGDLDTLLGVVCTQLGYVPEITLQHFRHEPVRLKVMPPDDIESIWLAMGVTTGRGFGPRPPPPYGPDKPGGGPGGWGPSLFLPPRTILVPRADDLSLLAYQFVHLLRYVTRSGPTGLAAEHEATRIAAAIT